MSNRLIVVDDSKMVRDIMSFTVQSAGYEVDTASNGAEALEMMTHSKYSLALVDLNMPIMDGYTLIAKIRQQKEHDEIPILIVSTECDAVDRERGLDAGANLFLSKPVDEKELLANIQMLIGAGHE